MNAILPRCFRHATAVAPLVLGLALSVAAAGRGLGAPAAPASTALTNLLEELTTWATAPQGTPPPRPGPPFQRPQLSSLEVAREQIRAELPVLWLHAGQSERAERLAASETVDFKRQGNLLSLAAELFVVRRDEEALRLVEASSTEPIDLRAQTLLVAAMARVRAGDVLGADALLEKAILWHDTNQVVQPTSLLYGFAQAQVEAHRTNEALASLARAVQWAKTHPATGEQPMLSFTLRDIAHVQAQLGRQVEAMATADLIPEAEQRLTARLFVTQSYAAAGNADGAVQSVRSSLKADAAAFVRLPFAIHAPVEAAAALAESGRPDEAVGFLDECIAMIRSQPMDATQEEGFKRATGDVRGMLVSRLLLQSQRATMSGVIDPKRLEWLAEIGGKSDSFLARKSVADAREQNRMWDELRAGRVPAVSTLDVSSPAAVERAQRWAHVLMSAGREEDAVRLGARLNPVESRRIHESAVRAALARTNLTLARQLLATLPAAGAEQEPGGDATFRISMALTHSLAIAGRTNEAVDVLNAAMKAAQTGPQRAPNHWLMVMQGAVLQADLGLFPEALGALTAGSSPMATMGGPKIGRRMVRRLGAEAAIDQARKLESAEVGKRVLLGIAQEMAKPGGD